MDHKDNTIPFNMKTQCSVLASMHIKGKILASQLFSSIHKNMETK